MTDNKVGPHALTFDDVLLLPKKAEATPQEISVNTCLTNKIKLSIPIVSAAMDTKVGLASFTRISLLKIKL
jgi:IMP dehydrogenase